LIYKEQSLWTRAGDPAAIVGELRKIGLLAGLDGDQLEACLQDGEKLQSLVAWYQINSERDGVQSTPSFMINGKMATFSRFEEMFSQIDAELGN